MPRGPCLNPSREDCSTRQDIHMADVLSWLVSCFTNLEVKDHLGWMRRRMEQSMCNQNYWNNLRLQMTARCHSFCRTPWSSMACRGKRQSLFMCPIEAWPRDFNAVCPFRVAFHMKAMCCRTKTDSICNYILEGVNWRMTWHIKGTPRVGTWTYQSLVTLIKSSVNM